MSRTLQILRGAYANIPTLANGEFGYCTDTNQLFIGNNSTNKEIATKEQLNEKADLNAYNVFTSGIELAMSSDVKISLRSTDSDNYNLIQCLNSSSNTLSQFGYFGTYWGIDYDKIATMSNLSGFSIIVGKCVLTANGARTFSENGIQIPSGTTESHLVTTRIVDSDDNLAWDTIIIPIINKISTPGYYKMGGVSTSENLTIGSSKAVFDYVLLYK